MKGNGISQENNVQQFNKKRKFFQKSNLVMKSNDGIKNLHIIFENKYYQIKKIENIYLGEQYTQIVPKDINNFDINSMEHDNILQIRQEENLLIAEPMEYTLQFFLQQTIFEIDEFYIIKQIVNFIQFLHSQDLAHAKLCTRNILINEQQQIKAVPLPQEGVQYCAPERIINYEVENLKSEDMFQLGCIILEILSKKPVLESDDEANQMLKYSFFLGRPTEAMYSQILHDLPNTQPIDIDSYLIKNDKRLVQLLPKLLAYDPQQRPTIQYVYNYLYQGFSNSNPDFTLINKNNSLVNQKSNQSFHSFQQKPIRKQLFGKKNCSPGFYIQDDEHAVNLYDDDQNDLSTPNSSVDLKKNNFDKSSMMEDNNLKRNSQVNEYFMNQLDARPAIDNNSEVKLYNQSYQNPKSSNTTLLQNKQSQNNMHIKQTTLPSKHSQIEFSNDESTQSDQQLTSPSKNERFNSQIKKSYDQSGQKNNFNDILNPDEKELIYRKNEYSQHSNSFFIDVQDKENNIKEHKNTINHLQQIFQEETKQHMENQKRQQFEELQKKKEEQLLNMLEEQQMKQQEDEKRIKEEEYQKKIMHGIGQRKNNEQKYRNQQDEQQQQFDDNYNSNYLQKKDLSKIQDKNENRQENEKQTFQQDLKRNEEIYKQKEKEFEELQNKINQQKQQEQEELLKSYKQTEEQLRKQLEYEQNRFSKLQEDINRKKKDEKEQIQKKRENEQKQNEERLNQIELKQKQYEEELIKKEQEQMKKEVDKLKKRQEEQRLKQDLQKFKEDEQRSKEEEYKKKENELKILQNEQQQIMQSNQKLLKERLDKLAEEEKKQQEYAQLLDMKEKETKEAIIKEQQRLNEETKKKQEEIQQQLNQKEEELKKQQQQEEEKNKRILKEIEIQRQKDLEEIRKKELQLKEKEQKLEQFKKEEEEKIKVFQEQKKKELQICIEKEKELTQLKELELIKLKEIEQQKHKEEEEMKRKIKEEEQKFEEIEKQKQIELQELFKQKEIETKKLKQLEQRERELAKKREEEQKYIQELEKQKYKQNKSVTENEDNEVNKGMSLIVLPEALQRQQMVDNILQQEIQFNEIYRQRQGYSHLRFKPSSEKFQQNSFLNQSILPEHYEQNQNKSHINRSQHHPVSVKVPHTNSTPSKTKQSRSHLSQRNEILIEENNQTNQDIQNNDYSHNKDSNKKQKQQQNINKSLIDGGNSHDRSNSPKYQPIYKEQQSRFINQKPMISSRRNIVSSLPPVSDKKVSSPTEERYDQPTKKQSSNNLNKSFETKHVKIKKQKSEVKKNSDCVLPSLSQRNQQLQQLEDKDNFRQSRLSQVQYTDEQIPQIQPPRINNNQYLQTKPDQPTVFNTRLLVRQPNFLLQMNANNN